MGRGNFDDKHMCEIVSSPKAVMVHDQHPLAGVQMDVTRFILSWQIKAEGGWIICRHSRNVRGDEEYLNGPGLAGCIYTTVNVASLSFGEWDGDRMGWDTEMGKNYLHGWINVSGICSGKIVKDRAGSFPFGTVRPARPTDRLTKFTKGNRSLSTGPNRT